MLGGVSLALAPDVAEATTIPRAPKGREEGQVQLARLLHAHEVILLEARSMARLAAARGDDGTSDLIVSGIIRPNEMQVWLMAQHLVGVPLAEWT
jgi:starvation-inducible DNA-binding protein